MTLKGNGMLGPNLKAAFQISPPKIGQFLSSRQRGSKFQILLLSFVWKVNSQEFHFVTLKGLGMFGPKLSAAFQIIHPKIGQFLWSMPVGSKYQILLGFLFEREAA